MAKEEGRSADPLQEALNNFNDLLFSDEYNAYKLTQSITTYQSLGLQTMGQNPDRLFSQLKLMANQAANVAKRNNDGQGVLDFTALESGFNAAVENFKTPEQQSQSVQDETPRPRRGGRSASSSTQESQPGPTPTDQIRPAARRAAG